jgi:flavin-dependent dehydrogenase
MYDAIVVGARCAGSPTAMLLARQGHRVLLVDRDTFPSDTFRAHAVRTAGATALMRWGLYETVVATGCPQFRSYAFDMDDFPLKGYPSFPEGAPLEIAPRRKVLDAILVRAAVEAGAELREQVVIDDLLWEEGRVVGVQGRSGGQAFEERARLVIGADGQHSLVARKVDAPITQSTPPLTFGYYTYWADLPADGLEVFNKIGAGRVIIVFPTNEDLTCVAVQAPIDDFPAFRADLEGGYFGAIALAEELAARVRKARRAERFQGTADLPNFIRKATGPGWALVGDAGFHRDPLLALGISNAFRDAEALAETVGDALAGAASLDDALAAYERMHAEAAQAGFEETVGACSFRPFPPELLGARAAVRGNQAATNRFYDQQFGLTPPG